MEETIGYEALFSAEEWDALMSGDWTDVPPDDFPERKEGVPHRVTVMVVDDGYELTCDSCDLYEHFSDVIDADNLRRLHEAFVATPVKNWSVDR